MPMKHQAPQINMLRLSILYVTLFLLNTVIHPISSLMINASSITPSKNTMPPPSSKDNNKQHHRPSSTSLSSSSSSSENSNKPILGRLEELKSREARLSRLLAAIRREKLSVIQSRPLTIGVVGFGRFGQFIARTFTKYGRVVVTSRSDYTDIATGMGVTYVPLSDLEGFVGKGLDVIVLAVSIVSFEDTVRSLVPYIEATLRSRESGGSEMSSGDDESSTMLPGPLVVDVLSVKDYPRRVLLDLLPPQCDILCTHPMFGPDSGKHGWHGLNFVYERTRIDGVLLDPTKEQSFHQLSEADNDENPDHDMMDRFVDIKGGVHSVHEDSEAHILGMDRMERFLSIWEEEGCRMVAMSCQSHDEYAANSQFITHLMGRILGTQGLKATPIDTRGFESVLKLIGSTTTDSFDLFYGLYKYNQNSMETILKLRTAMDDVVDKLRDMEQNDKQPSQYMTIKDNLNIIQPQQQQQHDQDEQQGHHQVDYQQMKENNGNQKQQQHQGEEQKMALDSSQC